MSDHLIAEANRHARALIIERDQLRTELALLREWQREVIQNANAHHAERRQANARAERAEGEVKMLGVWREGVIEDAWAHKANLEGAIARAKRAEAELDGIRALADRRNKRDHSQDTTHQLVAALDQALDIAQAELAQFRELDAERARMRQIAVDNRIRTPTPRTDEEAGSLIDAEEVVPADFARTLERELATERARLDFVDQLSPNDAWIICPTGAFSNATIRAGDSRTLKSLPGIRAAIDAAMKDDHK